MDATNVEESGPQSLSDWGRHWSVEFTAAKKELELWQAQVRKIEDIVRDERPAADKDLSKWNLFCANLETKEAMLYGRPPQVSVDRRFADQEDDDARVAADMLGRNLNQDIERKSDGFKSALRYALRDRLQGGWGNARARYVVKTEKVAAVPETEMGPEIPAHDKKTFEDVETDYIHWADQLWSPSRFFHEMGWWAHKSGMSRPALVKRWGEEIGNAVPLNGKDPGVSDGTRRESQWGRADVWEIWDKDHSKVFWYVEGYGVLSMEEDPYELDGFWPFPMPMVANLTNSKLVPRPDYVIAQDIYAEINTVTTRIANLIKFIKVRGTYDKTVGELATLLDGPDGVLVPAEMWAALAQKGGIKGSVDFFDFTPVVNAVLQLRDYRRELVDAVNQITGMADIMRGQATQAGATATEQRIKAGVGSVRMQYLQDDFARFASELQNIRAQLIAKFFEPETIIQRCNCKFGKDQDRVPAAVELIKSGLSKFRIEIKPENVSMTDFAMQKQERLESLAGLSQFFNMAAPIAQGMPGSMPFLLEIGQWAISGMRGASQLESSFDKAITQLEKAQEEAAANPKPQQPDPKLEAQRVKAQTDVAKGQMDIQKEQLKHENKLVEIQAETQSKNEQEQVQAYFNTQEAQRKAAIAHAYKQQEPKPNGVP